jgi:thiol:disulfide interchange protein DsbC
MAFRHLLRTLTLISVLSIPIAATVAPSAVIAQTTAPASAEIDALRKALEAKFPQAKVGNIRRAQINGLFEATLDGDVVYTDPSGKFLFAGAMYEVATMTNLTEARVSELFGFKWDELPLEKSIKMVKGKGTRRVAVFTDADCPFCKRIEQTFEEMDDITVYNFLMPIDSLHPDAGRKSKIIWCSADRLKSWQDFMLKGKLVEGKGDCANPVEELKALGQSKKVNGTPMMVLPDNRSLAGALPRARLEEEFSKAEAAAKSKKS